MFDIALMDTFYAYESDPKFTITNDVKNAYYIFVRHICTEVAPKFKSHLSDFQNHDDQRKYKPNLTMTDEAFAFWIVKLKYEECAKDAEEIHNMECNLEKWSSRKKAAKKDKDKEKNEYTKHYGKYFDLCTKIQELRNNEKGYKLWIDIFYDKLVEKIQTFDPSDAAPPSPFAQKKPS